MREGGRPVYYLSSPEGHSVKEGIPKPLFSVHYVTVDSFIEGIMARGRGTLMAKFDVASAYRNVAVHPQDRSLLGMRWRGKYYVDMALPIGLRLALYIFTAIADMVEWVLTQLLTMGLLSCVITWRGGHWGLRYWGIGQFFMRYFGNFNFKLRYCGVL